MLCIFWFCNHLHTSWVVSIFDDDVCVSLFISHVLFLFSLYTRVSCLFNLLLFSTWYLDVFCLVPFRKDKLRFRTFFLQQLPRFRSFRLSLFILQSWVECNLGHSMYSCGFVTDYQSGRLLRTYFYVIGISFYKTHFTCI